MYKVMVTTASSYGEYNVVVNVIEFESIYDARRAVLTVNAQRSTRYTQTAIGLNFRQE